MFSNNTDNSHKDKTESIYVAYFSSYNTSSARVALYVAKKMPLCKARFQQTFVFLLCGTKGKESEDRNSPSTKLTQSNF